MRISRLEIRGFKSFPDKTVLEFKPGITAVVGPNGCGKSNIFEAIRWVMGEQRARILRGQKMGDVIFNGSESRKPVGMAEVRMTLSGADQMFPHEMSEFDEIMIGRLLYRDGESRYEINNIPCRLGDVTDLFLDTGVGRNSYAVIEQGRVEMIVASKPEDRRVLIEEAAGINRYKARKEEALRKLEQTGHNLERIRDVIAEVRGRSESLKRQSARAERYRQLQMRLRELETAFQAHRCDEAMQRLDACRIQREEVNASLSESETHLTSLASELQSVRLKFLEREKDLKLALQKGHSVEIELTAVRGRIETDSLAVISLRERQQGLNQTKTEHEENIRKIGVSLRQLEEETAALDTQIISAGEKLEIVLSESGEIARRRDALVKQLDELKDDLFRNLQTSAQHRNDREVAKRRLQEIENRLLRVSRENATASSELARAHVSCEQATDFLVDLCRGRQDLARESALLTMQRKESAHQAQEIREKLAHSEISLVSNRARLDSLQELQRNFANYDQSVRYLMKNQEQGTTSSLLGPLAELVESEQEFERPLAAVLGDRIGHLVVGSPRDGAEAAKSLRVSGHGRATFIPVNPRCGFSAACEPTVEGQQPLKDVVRFREGFEELGNYLFDGYFVVQDIDQALSMWERNGIQADLVSMDGDILSRSGEITGGAWDKTAESVFSVRREMANLRKQVDSLEKSVNDDRRSGADKEDLLETLSVDVKRVDVTAGQLMVAEAYWSAELNRDLSKVSEFESMLEVLKIEEQRLQGEKSQVMDAIGNAETSLATSEDIREHLEASTAKMRRELTKIEGMAGGQTERTNELRVLSAQLEERRLNRRREYEALQVTAKELGESLHGFQDHVNRIEAEARKVTESISLARNREKELMGEHKRLTTTIHTLESQADSNSNSLRSLEGQTSECSKSIREKRELVHAVEMECARLEEVIQGIVRGTMERYGVDPRSIPLAAAPPDSDDIAKARNKLESMTEVNLGAIEESRQIDERLKFLREQERDLEKSLASLFETIRKINSTTEELFASTFEKVNEKFQEIFPFLFRGGEAHLELTEGSDLLQTGIDIMARPPGKRRQSMGLLSGGEKALTAVALIFSIFLTRPSPFCLLDEVDAPLDDSNIARFNEMLKRLSDRTQFVMITHNKRSMEAADNLYGITMDEPGVSTVVSVTFAN